MNPETTMRVEIPKQWWLTANMRLHWAQKAERTRWLRQAAKLQARNLKSLQKAAIYATSHGPRKHGGDIDGPAPTVKALIDGIVDAGVLPDDTPEFLTSLTYDRGKPTGKAGTYAITLLLIDQSVSF